MALSNNGASRKARVMIVGFDGATFDLIQPWVDQGLLPNFKRLMREGAWGTLDSTMPPVTPAAWSSLATGTTQGKHGLFDFFGRQPGSYHTYLVNATHRHGTPLWQLLGSAGLRSTVFNVPASYPPEKVNGLMVTGLLTPTHATDATWPNALLEELKAAVPEFSFYPPGIFSRGEEVAFVNEVLEWDRMTLRATEFLLKRAPWDFFFTVFIGVDIMSHFMWREMVTRGASVESKDAATREALATAIQRVYQQADEILGRMLQEAGEDCYVMVVSDHGFGSLDSYMHPNTWLVEKGYLQFKRTPEVRLKTLAYRMGLTPLRILETMRALKLGGKVKQGVSQHNDRFKALVKRAFLSLDDIDWSRTTAYAAGFGGPIYVNMKGREPQGIVEPGAEFEALLARITKDLRELRHPVTGEPYVGEIYRPEELYEGPYAHLAPDLMFMPRDWANQGYGVHDFASNRWLEPTPDRTGTHRMNGIFYLTGPGVQAGAKIEGAALWDVAPTVLALMDQPIPTHMDGQVLMDALGDELRRSLHIRHSDEAVEAEPERAAPELSEEEERTMRERLQALGYYG